MGEKGDLVDSGVVTTSPQSALDRTGATASGLVGDAAKTTENAALGAVAGAAVQHTITPIIGGRDKTSGDEHEAANPESVPDSPE